MNFILCGPKVASALRTKWETSPSTSPMLSQIRAMLREELDRKSFATASKMLTLGETMEYLKLSKSGIYELRQARRRALSEAEAEQAFPPDHGTGKLLRFDRHQLDAWQRARSPMRRD